MAIYQELTEKEFDAAIQKDFILIEFWAAWCIHCRNLELLLKRSEAELPPELQIGKVEIDANPALASRFQIETVPTLMLFRNGEKQREYSGAVTRSALLDFIQLS